MSPLIAHPAYLAAFETGRLAKALKEAMGLLESCALCPRRCGVNRLKDERGFCETGLLPKVYSHFAHPGEEPPISGSKGSGTIFFSGCNLHCVYCQNHRFSQQGEGKTVAIESLAETMLKLQGKGCHNINLVTPTHVMPQILQALAQSIPAGLDLPIVYNTGGYEMLEPLQLLDGIVDIYLPDMRYADPAMSAKYSDAPDYPERNQAAVQEMFRQVGLPVFDEEGIIQRGLIIRHLVLPHRVSGTREILRFLKREISPEVPISLMSQYHPYFRAQEHPALARRITEAEYDEALAGLEALDLENGWRQEHGGSEDLAGVHFDPKE